MSSIGTLVGVGAAQRALLGLADNAMGPIRQAVTETALWARGAVAAGAPRDTGDYSRSITHKVRTAPTTVEADVSTNRPQGRRLEFGFHGVDSLGRRYDQAAQPHWEPVRAKLPGVLRQAVIRHVGKL